MGRISLLSRYCFCVVTSSRCHTLGLKRWNGLCYTRDNSVTTKILLSHAWLIVYLRIISSVTTWQQKWFLRVENRWDSRSLHDWLSLSSLAVRRRRRRRSLSPYPHGFTLALLGHHPRLSMVRLHRRRDFTKIMLTIWKRKYYLLQSNYYP